MRRCILSRINANVAQTKIELFVGGELIEAEDDRKLVEQLNLKDKSVSKYDSQIFSKILYLYHLWLVMFIEHYLVCMFLWR